MAKKPVVITMRVTFEVNPPVKDALPELVTSVELTPKDLKRKNVAERAVLRLRRALTNGAAAFEMVGSGLNKAIREAIGAQKGEKSKCHTQHKATSDVSSNPKLSSHLLV